MESFNHSSRETAPSKTLESPREFKSFIELAEHLGQMYPQATKISVDREIQLLAKAEQRDDAVEHQGFIKTLKEYGISTEGFKHVGEKRWVLSHKDGLREELPAGYAFKGGAARYYLHKSLGLPAGEPRDYDVVRLGRAEPYNGADNEIAERFMPKDLEFGDGVEPVMDIEEYFETRDLTINEVLASKEEIMATEGAILDAVRGILRLTEFERYNYDGSGVAGPKMLAKLLRFYAEGIQYDRGALPELEEIDRRKINEEFISPFWLAVNLDRAWEKGGENAARYVRVLVSSNQLPETIDTPEDAARYLLDCMDDPSFVFRSVHPRRFEMEDEWVEELHIKESEAIARIRKRLIRR